MRRVSTRIILFDLALLTARDHNGLPSVSQQHSSRPFDSKAKSRKSVASKLTTWAFMALLQKRFEVLVALAIITPLSSQLTITSKSGFIVRMLTDTAAEG
jgi:hypothetical protein